MSNLKTIPDWYHHGFSEGGSGTVKLAIWPGEAAWPENDCKVCFHPYNSLVEMKPKAESGKVMLFPFALEVRRGHSGDIRDVGIIVGLTSDDVLDTHIYCEGGRAKCNLTLACERKDVEVLSIMGFIECDALEEGPGKVLVDINTNHLDGCTIKPYVFEICLEKHGDDLILTPYIGSDKNYQKMRKKS